MKQDFTVKQRGKTIECEVKKSEMSRAPVDLQIELPSKMLKKIGGVYYVSFHLNIFNLLIFFIIQLKLFTPRRVQWQSRCLVVHVMPLRWRSVW